MKNLFAIIGGVGLIAGTSCCGGNEEGPAHNPNRQAMVQTLHTEMQTDVGHLLDAATRFDTYLEADSALHLDSAKTYFLALCEQFSKFQVWDFGPSKDLNFVPFTNTFPTDTGLILEQANSGPTWNLDQASFSAAVGLPAVDFLLNRIGFNGFNPQEFNFLKAISEAILQKSTSLHQAYFGSFGTAFLSNLDIAAGSSLSEFVNEFNRTLEFSKNFRIGIPSGVRTLGEPLPEKVELLYLGQGKTTLLASIERLHYLFLGNETQYGLRDYLDALAVQKSGQALSKLIDLKFQEILLRIDQLPQQLADAPSEELVGIFQEMQDLIVYTKSDMASAMGIQISYVDNDGD